MSWDQSQSGGWAGSSSTSSGGGGSRPPQSGGGGPTSVPDNSNKNTGGGGGGPPHAPPPMMRVPSHGGSHYQGGSNSGNNDPSAGGGGGVLPNSALSSHTFGEGGRGRGGAGGRFGGGRHGGGRFGDRGRQHGRGLGRGGHPPSHRGSFSGGHPSGPPPRLGRDRDERVSLIDNAAVDRGGFGNERERERDRFGSSSNSSINSNDADFHHHPHSSPREMSVDFRGRRGGTSDDGLSFRDRGNHRDGSLGAPPLPIRDSPFRHTSGGSDRFERTRSEGAVTSPYPSSLERRTSFDQQRGPFPRGPRDFDHRRVGSHSTLPSDSSSPPASKPTGPPPVPPFSTALPMPSDRNVPIGRPTDPRRRGSSNDVVASLAAREVGSAVGSYTSLAEGNNYGPPSPNRPMGFRASPQALRRSISDGIARGYDVGDKFAPPTHIAKSPRAPPDERSQYPPMPSTELDGSQQRQPSRGGLVPKPMEFQHRSSSSNDIGSTGARIEPAFPSRRDPRSQQPERQGATRNITVDTSLNTNDPFGHARDWQQPSSQIRRSLSEGVVARPSPRVSPSRSRPMMTLPPITEKSILEAPLLCSSGTSIASVAAATSAASVPSMGPAKVVGEVKSKPFQIEELPNLKISSLGDADVVKRAETAVLHLQEVVQEGAEDKEFPDDLPSKADMLEAMSKIEKLITSSQNDLDDLCQEVDQAKSNETELQVKEAKERAEAEKQKALEIERIQNEKRNEEKKLKEEALQRALNECKKRSADEKKKMQDEFDRTVEEAKEKAYAEMIESLEADLSQDSAIMDKAIEKAEREFKKSKMILQKIEQAVVSAEKTYRALLAEDEKKEGNTSQSGAFDSSSVISSILLENKRKATEAQLLGFALADGIRGPTRSENEMIGANPERHLYETKDPTCNKTFEEWAILAQNVTGVSDALYSEPSETPYYHFNQKRHEMMGPIVKEYIRNHKTRLNEHWEKLSEEYEVRKRLYEKQQRKLAKKSRGSISTSRKSIFEGSKETSNRKTDEKEAQTVETAGSAGGRSTNNPYRRARRGDPVRSEYEQEQIIAQITEKEAMERRITHGGSKLPRQVCPLEQELTAVYVNTFNSHKVDPVQEAREEALTNIWTDMEKCIFLDRFLQFPKDFRRIASFLRNKTTMDCIAFYYDSKQTVPYKGALKEHILRRKKKGEYQVWDASIQSAVSCGAIITAGDGDEKPINFGLPKSDLTYRTHMLHPLKRAALDSMEIDVTAAETYVTSGRSDEDTTKWKSRKRGRDPLFSLTKEQTKRLRKSSQEALMNPIERAKLEEKERVMELSEAELVISPKTKRLAPQKWTASEKRIFVETLEQHGRDWARLSQAVGTKTISQIKNFYYDFKKQLSSGKFRSGMEKGNFKASASVGEPSSVSKEELVPTSPQRENFVKKKKKKVDSGGVPPSLPKLSSKSTAKKPSTQRQLTTQGSGKSTPTESSAASVLSMPYQGEVAVNDPQMMQHIQSQMPANQSQMPANQSQMPANPQIRSNEIEMLLSGSPGYGPNYTSHSELIQQLLQQQPHHFHHQPHPEQQFRAEAESQLAARLLQQQQSQQQREHQSSLELLLRGQNHHPGQLTLEDTRRLLQHQSPNFAHLQQPHQHSIPSGLQESAQPDLSDTSNLQRILQLQQQHNPLVSQRSNLGSLLGLSTAADTGISASLLAQLRGGQVSAEPAGFSNLSSMQEFLAGGGNPHAHRHQLGGNLPGGFHQSSHNPLYAGNNQGGQPPDVTQSEAFALLQRAMRDRNNFHG